MPASFRKYESSGRSKELVNQNLGVCMDEIMIGIRDHNNFGAAEITIPLIITIPVPSCRNIILTHNRKHCTVQPFCFADSCFIEIFRVALLVMPEGPAHEFYVILVLEDIVRYTEVFQISGYIPVEIGAEYFVQPAVQLDEPWGEDSAD